MGKQQLIEALKDRERMVAWFRFYYMVDGQCVYDTFDALTNDDADKQAVVISKNKADKGTQVLVFKRDDLGLRKFDVVEVS